MVAGFFRCALACLAVASLAEPALADIYGYVDKDGVYHFTNIPSKVKGSGKEPARWRRIMKTGPGKASAVRGARYDRRPASDRSPERFARYDRHITEACTLYQIPEALVRAVIWVESDYDPKVVSHAGAEGLMQLMPSMSRGMGVRNPFDPRENIFGGTRLLRILANRFNGELVPVIAAYHAGSGAVKKYQGIPPYETTQKYVRWVLTRYYKLRKRIQDEARQKKEKARAY